MTYDITKVPITSKLMLLRTGCKNFRSVGEEEIIINLAENSNQLVIADQNGAGKSTLFEYLPYYAITGKSSRKEDKVDALINSTNFKKMSVFLEWHFAGTYYKVVRGRKPKIFDLFYLVDEEWIEIPNLPVSDSDRQTYMYTILGLDRKTAADVLENTILLSGQRFKGFSSLSTPERRDLIEPILDLTIFSSLNAETKSLRGGVISEQKETHLEIVDYDMKVALAEQEVQHKKQEISTLKASYNEQREILEDKVSKCTTELEEALQLDTEGLDFKEACASEVKKLKSYLTKLDNDLKKDLNSLGVFKIDLNDQILMKLRMDLHTLDQEIELAKEVLEEKRKSLNGEIKQVIDQTKHQIEVEKKNYETKILKLETENKEVCDELQIKKSEQEVLVKTLVVENKVAFTNLGECKCNVNTLNEELEKVLIKESQYKEKIEKLKTARDFILTKVAIEENNLLGLAEAGECPTCKQLISEEYLESCKADINSKLKALDEEASVYTERMEAGEVKVKELCVPELNEGLRVAKLQLEQENTGYIQSERNKVEQQYNLETLDVKLKNLKTEFDTAISSNEQEHKLELSKLQSVLDATESKSKEVLGEYEAKYNQLIKAKPMQVANLGQQIEDRKLAMKGEHGGKETHLKDIHKLAVENINKNILTLEDNLSTRLQQLVKDKDYSINACKNKLDGVQEELDGCELAYNNKVNLLIRESYTAEKNYVDLSDKLSKLNITHDKQQQDIEDYDDLLLLLSDKEGKSSIIANYIPQLNKDVNKYLEALNMFIKVEIDSNFNITMNEEERRGQSLFSLSAGQKSRLDLSILLALRDLAASKESVNSNLLVLDEILEPFSEEGLIEVIGMLQTKFADLNMVLITQRGNEVSDLFDNVKRYALRGGFTVELKE